MSIAQIIFTSLSLILTAIFIPLIIAEVRYRSRCAKRLSDIENFIVFLKTYLLKNAVLEFHSPEPQHKHADSIIERLVGDEELTPEEIDALAERIKQEAKYGAGKQRRLRATLTLALLDDFIDAVQSRKSPDALAEYERI